MIRQLTIKNLAIIDDITIEFENGYNVLTGQTGAGKSIIIDAISLIFGQRASNDIIANGKEMAYVSAEFELKDESKKLLKEIIDIDIEDEFIISRTLNINGRNTCKINGIIVPLFTLNEIASILVDISSQNDNQFLLKEKYHLELLDKFVEVENKNFLQDYQKEYKIYNELLNKLDLLKNKSNQEDLEYLKFKYNELKDYNYTLEDEENILNEFKNLQVIYKNYSLIEEVINYLDNDNNGSKSQTYLALKSLNKLANNEELENLANRLQSIYIDLDDFIDTFKSKYEVENFDENRLDYLENEISKINRLKRKYNVNDLLSLKNDLANKIKAIENFDDLLIDLNNSINKQKKILEKKAEEISAIRHKYAKILEKNVKQELNDLYLEDALFVVDFEKEDFTINGFEKVRFFMCANKGGNLAPLIKVASGGEQSRIMLGLKSIFCKLFNVDIVIFDEIDTGVSGKVATAVGRKMANIASFCQVLAITHLPQVAAFSTTHYYISKVYDGKITKTIVKKLNDDEKIYEVARLLSGDNITNSFISSAKELINSK